MHREPGFFRSYWIAVYKGADHINRRNVSQCLNHANRHNYKIQEDYAALKQSNIHTVRESVEWRLTELNQHFHCASLEIKAAAAQKHGLQVTWTLMHYAWPQDTAPLIHIVGSGTSEELISLDTDNQNLNQSFTPPNLTTSHFTELKPCLPY